MPSAIKPFSGPIPILPDAVSKEQLYPDSGVDYAGYFKRQIGNGRLEIFRQTPFFIEANSATADGLLTDLPSFVTTIHLYWIGVTGLSALGDEMNLFNGAQGTSASDAIWTHMVNNATEMTGVTQTFPTPLQFTQGIFLDNNIRSLITAGRVRLQIWGWNE